MAVSIKMVDLQGQYLKIKDEIDQAIQQVIDSGAFINGKPVQNFAADLTGFTGAGYVVPCANGTDALQIAYQTVGLNRGDEVIMPAFNYVASAEAAALLGLKPVFTDVWSGTFNINENLIEEKITASTKAVVVVHLFGQSANMEPILKLARHYGLKVIEDNAQSLGSEYVFSDGTRKLTGTMGDIGTYSFFPTKNLGCFGDGGAISANDSDLANKAYMISRHGQGEKYAYEMVGCNSRLDTIQAAILQVKLRYLDSYLENRIRAGNLYHQLLEGVPQIIKPSAVSYSKHTYNQYVIRLSNRDRIKELLREAEVPTMVYYPSPLHFQKAYTYLGNKPGDFPVAEKLCHEVLALPMHTELTGKEQAYVVDALLKSVK